MQKQVLVVVVLLSGLIQNHVQGVRADSDDEQQNDKAGMQAVKTMMEYLPMGSVIRYAAPNTFNGLDRDINNIYQSMTGALPNSVMANSYQMMNENLISPFQSMQQAVSNRYQATGDELMRAVEMMRNPQQMCSQIGQQAQMGYQYAQSGMDQIKKQLGSTSDTSNSMFSKLRPFGRK